MIGITIGDYSGIGPEITLKALNTIKNYKRNIRLIGSHQLLVKLAKQLKINTSLDNLVYDIPFAYQKYPVNPVFDDSLFAEDKPRRYEIIKFNRSVGARPQQDKTRSMRVYPQQIVYSKPQKQCGIASALQLHLASHLLKVGKIHGIVTAPVSKTALAMAGFPFPGQTEYFAAEFGVKKYGMLAWSTNLKIILVTIHKPLKDVPKLITEQNVLEKIKLLNDYLVRYEKKRKPKIGVLALNPHAFEFTCGAEEKILKAIHQARKLGISAQGPIPADSAFSNLGIRHSRCERPKGAWQSPEIPRYTRNDPSGHLRIPYDGYVSMYHDQGMLPVKLLTKGTGTNMTLGLPFIRTSPLHGVAFDIAGKGIANPSSMISAIQLCQKLTQE